MRGKGDEVGKERILKDVHFDLISESANPFQRVAPRHGGASDLRVWPMLSPPLS